MIVRRKDFMKKNNLFVLVGGILIVISVMTYSFFSIGSILHAGIGGTWSADMKTGGTGAGNASMLGKEYDSLKKLVRSGELSPEQRQDIQAQLNEMYILNQHTGAILFVMINHLILILHQPVHFGNSQIFQCKVMYFRTQKLAHHWKWLLDYYQMVDCHIPCM